jgi:catechol 2,3-dioxygenase-like lactoylglutathione lyase family enzyme
MLDRIRIATIAAPDIDAIESLYSTWLGHTVRERGMISAALAAGWGAPAAAGRRYLLMSTDAHPDVFIRAVQTDPVAGYRALTTWGWNAIEIIIDDIDALYERLKGSPFEFIGLPASLGARYPSIHAMQVKGPAEEVLYLTTETGDRSTSSLPLPGALVGRPFIMVIAGPDIQALRDWWTGHFNLRPQAINPSLGTLTRAAQNAAADAEFTISLVYLKQHGNILQLDGYPAATTARPRAPGQLPPGVAMTSFDIADLDALNLPFISPPLMIDAAPYQGRRVATTMAPGGALVELIESK